MKKPIVSSREPQLAVFWYIPETNTFVGDRGDISEGTYSGNFCELNYNHSERWAMWKGAYRVPDVEYDHYPRGRIIFNSKTHKYVVACDPCIVDKEKFKRAVCHEYGLDRNKVVWEIDEDYDCNECRR